MFITVYLLSSQMKLINMSVRYGTLNGHYAWVLNDTRGTNWDDEEALSRSLSQREIACSRLCNEAQHIHWRCMMLSSKTKVNMDDHLGENYNTTFLQSWGDWHISGSQTRLLIFPSTYDHYLFWSSSAHMYDARAPTGGPTASAHEIRFIWMFKFLDRTYTACKTLKGMDFSSFIGMWKRNFRIRK
jgi:hypothetical protein